MNPDAAVAADHDLFPKIAREARLSERVAGLMLDSIKSRRLEPGHRLPSERELGEQFGVSRTVIREAVRMLGAKGVLEVIPGSGLRVAAVGADTVRESMSLFLRQGAHGFDYLKVHEVRAMLEIHVAGVAATRASEEDIALLAKTLDAMEAAIDDVEAAAREDVEFHRLIAKTTHNELYVVMLDSIGDALLEIRRTTLAAGEWTAPVVKSHRAILRSIMKRDADAARTAMRAHLDEIEDAWRALTSTVSVTDSADAMHRQ